MIKQLSSILSNKLHQGVRFIIMFMMSLLELIQQVVLHQTTSRQVLFLMSTCRALLYNKLHCCMLLRVPVDTGAFIRGALLANLIFCFNSYIFKFAGNMAFGLQDYFMDKIREDAPFHHTNLPVSIKKLHKIFKLHFVCERRCCHPGFQIHAILPGFCFG